MDRKALVNSLKDMVASPMKLRARHPIETARMLSELLEASTRLGEYGKARARGKSAEEAALDSREVTLDFARIGSLTGSVNKISAFWNAQVQGADKFVRAHMENSKGTVAKATKAITLPSLMLYALNKDDPEYQDLPRWQKDFFWMVPTKGTALHEKTSFIPIPKPFLWGLVYGTSLERAAEWINEKDPKAFDGYLNSIGQASPFPTRRPRRPTSPTSCGPTKAASPAATSCRSTCSGSRPSISLSHGLPRSRNGWPRCSRKRVPRSRR